MRRYIVTWAQNATPVHEGFWAALQHCAAHYRAEVVVIPGRYRNPTSREEGADDEWWASDITAYIRRKVYAFCPGLAAHCEIPIQPTASRPLSGFEVFLGERSGIFGHPKRALETVPTSGRTPRLMLTTGAVTRPNYSDSKAGRKGARHHVLGAAIVEVDGRSWWVRQVSATSSGAFCDLDLKFTPDGVEAAPPPLTLTLGDYHNETKHLPTLAATERLIAATRPRAVVLHDFLDFRYRNHHDRTKPKRLARSVLLVEEEIRDAALELSRLAKAHWYVSEWVVVRSNHDEAFERWVEEHDDAADPLNAPYHHEVTARAYREMARTGEWPMLFELEARRLGAPKNARFLRRNDSYRKAGVEHGFHGDRGPRGTRGSIAAYARLGSKCTIGHGHTPTERDGAMMVGITANVDQGYNTLPDTNLPAHVLLHADSKRQMVVLAAERYSADDQP